jgi:hypothetical protein
VARGTLQHQLGPGATAPRRGPRRPLRKLSVAALLLLALSFTNTGKALVAPTFTDLRLAAPGIFGDGEYAFSLETAGQPVTFSSCDPIRIVVNDALQPPGADGLVEEAVTEVSRASGLSLTITGSTSEVPNPDRALEQPRYGFGWAPVLIAWTTPEVIPELAGDPIGRGGPRGVTYTASGVRVYVTGHVFLDTPALSSLLARGGHRAAVRATVMHELGHVLGLDHVGSPFELMSEGNYGLTRFGPGDLAGLRKLGTGPCV